VRRSWCAMNLWRLRLSILGTLALIIGISTLGFSLILSLLGTFSLLSLLILTALFNILQWLMAPYLINAIYKVKPLGESEYPELHRIVDVLSQRAGIPRPKLMLAEMPIPNAFAYGSPLTGNMVAVTRGLLRHLELEEVEAVIGHELGHIRHRDVQVMMFVSFLPSLFYLIARSTLYPYHYGYYARRRRGDYSALAVVGAASMFIYFILLIFTLALSRLREYYADQHSASIVDDGARKLAEALAKISTSTSRMRRAETAGFGGFKTLFISDPDRAVTDSAEIQALYGRRDEELVRRLLERKLTWFDRFVELFSTHPNVVKRIRALLEVS